MAISFVAAGTIWKFMYDYRPPGSPQTGTVNAAWLALGLGDQPRAWLVDTSTNNIALVLVGVWMLTGFAMVILVGRAQGHPDRTASKPPASTAPPSGNCFAASPGR